MALPTTITILLRNQQTLTVTNAVSESSEDVVMYNGDVYRNLFPAGYLGRQWAATVVMPFASPGSPESKDDMMTPTAPRFLQITRTMMKWLDSGGAVRGKCWADQFVGYADSADFLE